MERLEKFDRQLLSTCEQNQMDSRLGRFLSPKNRLLKSEHLEVGMRLAIRFNERKVAKPLNSQETPDQPRKGSKQERL